MKKNPGERQCINSILRNELCILENSTNGHSTVPRTKKLKEIHVRWRALNQGRFYRRGTPVFFAVRRAVLGASRSASVEVNQLRTIVWPMKMLHPVDDLSIRNTSNIFETTTPIPKCPRQEERSKM